VSYKNLSYPFMDFPGILLTHVSSREKVPNWITDEEGKASQKHVWEIIAKELESVVPGCVKRILEE
jgi:hypothetical protein